MKQESNSTRNTPSRAHKLAKQVLLFPVSPRAFSALVALLRALRMLRKPDSRSRDRIERIFVAHPYSSVGDSVLLIPLLERLHFVWPDVEIHIATTAQVAELLGAVPNLQCLLLPNLNLFRPGIPRSRKAFGRILFRYGVIRSLLGFYRREMMQYTYDLAIAPRWGSIATWPAVYLAFLTGAPRIIGYSGAVDGGSAAIDCLLTSAARGGSHEHESVRNLNLLNRAGVLEPSPDEPMAVDRPIPSIIALASPGHNADAMSLKAIDKPYAVISPGATAKFRIWPAERLTRVMQNLHSQTGLNFYVVGSAGDTTLCAQTVGSLPHFAASLAGRTSLRELVRLLAGAQLFIGMDSGTAHIAGALGIPTVVLSPFPSSCAEEHPNSPIRFRPCGPRVRVLQPEYALTPCDPTCSFPGPHCIQQITAVNVLEVATELLREGGESLPGILEGWKQDYFRE